MSAEEVPSSGVQKYHATTARDAVLCPRAEEPRTLAPIVARSPVELHRLRILVFVTPTVSECDVVSLDVHRYGRGLLRIPA